MAERHKLLFSTTDRDASHKKLDEVRSAGKHPEACCREDPSADKPYQVWTGPPSPHVLAAPAPKATPEGDPLYAGVPANLVDDIAKRVVELLTKGAP
jgi:hypothetical protein